MVVYSPLCFPSSPLVSLNFPLPFTWETKAKELLQVQTNLSYIVRPLPRMHMKSRAKSQCCECILTKGEMCHYPFEWSLARKRNKPLCHWEKMREVW